MELHSGALGAVKLVSDVEDRPLGYSKDGNRAPEARVGETWSSKNLFVGGENLLYRVGVGLWGQGGQLD